MTCDNTVMRRSLIADKIAIVERDGMSGPGRPQPTITTTTIFSGSLNYIACQFVEEFV